LPEECNLARLDTRYVDEGFIKCAADHRARTVRPVLGIEMKDREALEQIQPCFKTRIMSTPVGVFRLRTTGLRVGEMLRKMRRTKARREKDVQALRACRSKAKQLGYRYVG